MEAIHLIIHLEKNDYPEHVAKLVKTLLAQKNIELDSASDGSDQTE